MADYWNLRHADGDERGEERRVEWRVKFTHLGSGLNSAQCGRDDPRIKL